MPASPNLRTRATRLVAGLRERHRWLEVALRGYARYQRTEGSVAAVHVAYSAFFSLFPLMFAAVGIFGLVLRNNPELRDRILEEAAASTSAAPSTTPARCPGSSPSWSACWSSSTWRRSC
jgi:uncharacterized BrkB/YihY/UPF0761 family membrane protein